MDKMKKASVCIATYNGEKYIKEQLDSILSQIGSEDEVIISDDGSTDGTINVIKEIPDSRIKLIFNDGRHGYTGNFENALNHSSGDYIFLSDQDDVWLPEKCKIVCELLSQYDLVVTNSKVTDENLNVKKESFFDIYNSGTGILKNIIICSTYYGSCMALRQNILPYVLPVPKTKMIDYDVWIGLVAEVVGKVFFCRTPLLLYRRVEQSITSTESLLKRSEHPLWWKVYKRLVQLYLISEFYFQYKITKLWKKIF
ncbi:glycosyltransferase [Candidatus Symbiothrix dinenymphae]|nr:glycosyltransferase [Candidatus Symbiothrix dinenymphae]